MARGSAGSRAECLNGVVVIVVLKCLACCSGNSRSGENSGYLGKKLRYRDVTQEYQEVMAPCSDLTKWPLKMNSELPGCLQTAVDCETWQGILCHLPTPTDDMALPIKLRNE